MFLARCQYCSAGTSETGSSAKYRSTSSPTDVPPPPALAAALAETRFCSCALENTNSSSSPSNGVTTAYAGAGGGVGASRAARAWYSSTRRRTKLTTLSALIRGLSRPPSRATMPGCISSQCVILKYSAFMDGSKKVAIQYSSPMANSYCFRCPSAADMSGRTSSCDPVCSFFSRLSMRA
ncbi:unnamed protein product [Closterium sp. NIES-54]